MPDLADGETMEMKGSGAKPYILKNVGGVYSCSCPAWRNQSTPIDKRTCKHLRKLRGDEAEKERLGGDLSKPAPAKKVTAPPLLLAESWDGEQDPKGWFMSEKLDGVRAYWDGENFISRLGNTYYAPTWFKEGLPKNMPLDGELWMDRKAFQKTISIVRRQDGGEQWRQIVYMIFDAPQIDGEFEFRIVQAKQKIRVNKAKYAQALDHIVCKNMDHLKKELARIEKLGGEGLMLREPNSRYIPGRNSSLLKVKSFKDAEGEVIGHEPGKGRHKGRLGALTIKMPDGTQFSVGSGFTDAEREDPPAIGSIITYQYQELSDGGVPRFPTYLRVREE